MSNAFNRFIREQLDMRGWNQADLMRASGLSRSHVSKIVKDKRDRLPRLPADDTLVGISTAFSLDVAEVRRIASLAVGIADGPAPTYVFELREATNRELLAELGRRLGEAGDVGLEVVPDAPISFPDARAARTPPPGGSSGRRARREQDEAESGSQEPST